MHATWQQQYGYQEEENISHKWFIQLKAKIGINWNTSNHAAFEKFWSCNKEDQRFFKNWKRLKKNFQNFFKSDREKRLRIFWKREGENIFREGEFARRMKRRLGLFGDEIFLSMKFVVIVVRAYLSHWITMISYDNEA